MPNKEENNHERLMYEEANDATEMKYYLIRLSAAMDCLLAIYNKKNDFRIARFESQYKEMLTLYLLLDDIEQIIKDMRAKRLLLNTTKEASRAALEVLPGYLRNGKS